MKRYNLNVILLYGLICCFITFAGCVINISGYSTPRSKYEKTVELSKPMPEGTLFSAGSNDGWITITGDDVTECSVTATIIARAESDEKAQKIAEESNVKLEKFGSRMTLKLEKPVLRNNESVDIRFTAIVPKTCDLEINTDDGDITIENINGDIEIKTDDGKVNISQIDGDIIAGSDDGSITIDNVNIDNKLQRNNGRIDIQTDDGRVILSRILGNIKVRSDDGSARAEGIVGDVDMQSDDGRITAIYCKDAGGVYNVSMVTNDGAIDFTAPANFSADVEVITDDGSVNTDLPIQVRGKLGKRGIKGVIGAGQGRLFIKTDDGSVRIR